METPEVEVEDLKALELEVDLIRGTRLDLNSDSNLIRTFFVFTDVPKHLELRVGGIPLLTEGTLVEFDLALRNPRNINKTRRIYGIYKLTKRILKFSSSIPGKSGLTQYIEWSPTPG